MNKRLAEALEKFHQGECSQAYRILGCHRAKRRGQEGFVFRVWAPRAKQVHVVGDFNFWNLSDLPMEKVTHGVWEAFSGFAKEGNSYKYYIEGPGGNSFYKSDPYGFAMETLPETSSKIYDLEDYNWQDQAYRAKRRQKKSLNRPVNIYEVHLGSWKRNEDGSCMSYEALAEELIPYVKQMGYTHIELLPIAEYPYDPSWGYQVTGYFAPTFRYGMPWQLKYFIDCCHKVDIGVILDWVPAHFPKDAYGLYEFDGTCCYELDDPLMNEHPDWTTRIFDYGKGEVQSFLISNAVYWLKEFHFDGIRVDAVASMLYLDYNRGQWRPNRYGGRENLEAIAFLQKLNTEAFRVNANVMMIAEESTTFPLVTKPGYDHGLGFLYKWNMGWMHDVLKYMGIDPVYRKWHHNALTFSMTYAFSENFILPLSHDEVVHGKKSLIEKMYGSYDEKFQNLRALYMYMMAHPGKKLTFMGSEFAQFIEWNDKRELDWFLLGYERHSQMKQFVQALNHFYLEHSALWQNDSDWDGFQWVNPDDSDRNIISFRRIDRKGSEILVVCNFCPVCWEHYVLGLPQPGTYVPVLCSDSAAYGGSGIEPQEVEVQKKKACGFAYSGEFLVPPLSVVYYKLKKAKKEK